MIHHNNNNQGVFLELLVAANNKTKSKVIRCLDVGGVWGIILSSDGLRLEEVFRYMGEQVMADWGCEKVVLQRVLEKSRVLDAPRAVYKR